MIILIALAASTPQIESCSAAVNTNLAQAVAACSVVETKIDLFGKQPSVTAECMAALSAGVDAGKLGPALPPAYRAGLVKNFNAKRQKCLTAQPSPTVPMRDTVKLWD